MKVAITYKLTKDAVIDILEFRLQGREVKWSQSQTSSNVFEGEVTEVNVLNQIDVLLNLSGPKNANFKLELTAIKLKESGKKPDGSPRYVKTSKKFSVLGSPLEGKTQTGGGYYFNDFLTIEE